MIQISDLLSSSYSGAQGSAGAQGAQGSEAIFNFLDSSLFG
jgi:hypothetical protein